MEKIPGYGSGLGRVGVFNYKIVHFRVSFLLSCISGYSLIFLGVLDIISYLDVVSQILRFCLTFIEGLNHLGIPETSGVPGVLGNTRNLGFT